MTMRENSKSPSLAELIRMAVRQNQAEMHVSLPGRIETYDAAEQKADIQPLLQRVLVAEDGTELDPETLPILHDVPVRFARGGGFFQSFPLAEGDLVHLVFVERSMDQYLGGQGEVTRPLDFRMHNLSDAVAYPGLYPRGLSLSDAHAENAVWGKDGGGQIHIKPDGEVDIGSENAADFVALAQKVFDEIDALRTTVNSHITNYNSHIHTTTATVGPTAVPGVISPTVAVSSPPSPVSSVAADKTKAD
jgi:hypothetical protein